MGKKFPKFLRSFGTENDGAFSPTTLENKKIEASDQKQPILVSQLYLISLETDTAFFCLYLLLMERRRELLRIIIHLHRSNDVQFDKLLLWRYHNSYNFLMIYS